MVSMLASKAVKYAVTCKGPKGGQHAERHDERAGSLLSGTGVLHASRTSADSVSQRPTMLT